MKKFFSFAVAIVMLFSALTVNVFAQNVTLEEDSGISPYYVYAYTCDSSLTCSNFTAKCTVTVDAVSSVKKIEIHGYLLKYTSDGWETVYQFIKIDNDGGYVSVSTSDTINPFRDYCLKTVVTLTTASKIETITMYRYDYA